MDKTSYQISGYEFQSKEEYERALKEKETVSYLMANTDTTDVKAMLKIYNRSIEKESFRTVVGLEFMSNLRKRLTESGTISAESLAPIPVASKGVRRAKPATDENMARQLKHYKEAYENAQAGKTIKNIVLVFLVLIIFGMLFLTYKSQYSVFTYFTNYKENMREDLLDEYEEWDKKLQDKESELNQREQLLNEQEERQEQQSDTAED